MNTDEVYREIQKAARTDAARLGIPIPTHEYLIRHALELFLDRLNRTPYTPDFVLKGGLLLGAYGVRRPTKDADSNAISADTTPAHLEQVVRAVAEVAVNDGVMFDLDGVNVIEIRDGAEYPGLRLRVKVAISTWKGTISWDVSTGDPIVPALRKVTLDRVLGEPITLIGYAPESTVAEKGVTILERGITSTRWRDYVDIVTLGSVGLDCEALERAVRAVAAYRGIELQPIGPVVEGHGALSQAKW
ncbi:nucleotidyl transferase AbiEii/AbiGii toxin family protein [Leucobacter sp. UT-8R-CII-1-4]|uniref:nucleotidyl transferase AbiEii/AbiGii toxin family protein n=1 Tax=Leucobacter sp. UT-8R-CII-1-4 TaxID=3040075 RepID=UPI0024A7B0A4|nr:nucleotidyl transferase AbiEii/AbiGii toxin family protein [Leucobacter sp. UT-8R-CII-1-4]MDI6024052.1 nucleotidyl transferase AbiEii/AbiGii toxin family protein [Leucobacter sp. UT-8R-CII-1-4]